MAEPTNLTTEQLVTADFQVKDGRGRIVATDGTPTVAVSDASVASAAIAANGTNKWLVTLTALTPSPKDGDGNPIIQRLTVDADADLGAGVQDVVATADFNVTLDPRTGARISELTLGTPTDKPVG